MLSMESFARMNEIYLLKTVAFQFVCSIFILDCLIRRVQIISNDSQNENTTDIYPMY